MNHDRLQPPPRLLSSFFSGRSVAVAALVLACGRTDLAPRASKQLAGSGGIVSPSSTAGSAGTVAVGGGTGVEPIVGLGGSTGWHTAYSSGGNAGNSGLGGARGSGGETTATSTSTQTFTQLLVFVGEIGGKGNLDGVLSAARFYGPAGMAPDGKGGVLVADSANHGIRKIDIAGAAVTTVVVSPGQAGIFGRSKDQLDGPGAVVPDGIGNLYVADATSGVIRKVNLAKGTVTDLAGNPNQDPGNWQAVDGVGNSARFGGLADLVYDGAGALLVADKGMGVIRKIVVDSATVTTLVGTPWTNGDKDGVGSEARFKQPTGLALDGAGNLYVADSGNDKIRKIDLATRTVTTFVGFSQAKKLAYDKQGNLFVVNDRRTVGKVELATKKVATLRIAWLDEDPLNVASPVEISGLAIYGADRLYVADAVQNVVHEVSVSREVVVNRFGSARQQGTHDAIQTQARFFHPVGLSVDRKRSLFVADSGNHLLRRVEINTAEVRTVTAVDPDSRDGGGQPSASFGLLSHLAMENPGTLFIADRSSYTIRVMDTSTTVVTTLAGSAGDVGSNDGRGSGARFSFPSGVASDGLGTLFVADSGNHTVRKIKVSTGEVTTLAGAPGERGSSDGGAGTARFDSPSALALDGAGQLFVADTGNNSIRVVALATNQVTTFAGSTSAGSGDGIARSARFNVPSGLVRDSNGNLLVADTGNSTVRKIDIKTGAVTTIVGRAGRAGVAPGPLPAGLNQPQALAFGPRGQLYITDEDAILVAYF